MAPVYESDGELRVFEGSKGEEMWVEPLVRAPSLNWKQPVDAEALVAPLIEYRVWKRVR